MMIAPPPGPSMSELAFWVTLVFESLPTAVASPVVMPAVPSDQLEASPLLEATPMIAGRRRRRWSARGTHPGRRVEPPSPLSETLPTATLPPVLATATPTLATKAFWSMITRPPSAPPAEPVADWMMLVSDLLPVAEALPVLIVALPSELLVALPLLAAMPAAVLASCRRPAVLSESLPTATLPPRVGERHAAVEDVGVLVDDQDAAELAVGRAVGGLVDRGVRLVADRRWRCRWRWRPSRCSRWRRCPCWRPGRGRRCRSGWPSAVLLGAVADGDVAAGVGDRGADVRDVGLLVDHLDGAEVARDRDGLGAVRAGLVADGGGVTGVRLRRCRRTPCRRRSGRRRGRRTHPAG